MDNVAYIFGEVIKLLRELERQYGVGNARYTAYAIERLEYSIIACTAVHDSLVEDSRLEDYCFTLNELIECLRQVYYRWEEYQDIVDSQYSNVSLCYCVPVHPTGNVGRPRFEISRDQLLYLTFLSFKWTEIAALLGASRMTVYT